MKINKRKCNGRTKVNNQLKRVSRMNNIKNRAEEIILNDTR